MRLNIFAFLTSAITSTRRRTTVQDVLNDLIALKTQVAALYRTALDFPDSGGTLLQALTIHTQVVSTLSSLDKTTAKVKAVPTPVSLKGATGILNTINEIKPIIEEGLKTIVTKKPALDHFPFGGILGIVKQDLMNLQASTTSLADALIASAPPELLTQSHVIKDEILAAFATAIAAYT